MFNKKEKKQKNNGISGNVVHVVIKKKIGESLITTIAEFDAVQQQDENFTFKLVNDDIKFKEDYSFEKHASLELLEAKLSDLEKSKALEQIKAKIKSQIDRLKLIQDGYLFKKETDIKSYNESTTDAERDKINKEKINIIDEKNLLKVYKSLEFYYENRGDKTSYEELTEDGKRKVTFLARDGILTVFAINVSESNMYTDVSTKKKIYYEKDYEIEKRYLDSQKGDSGKVVFAIGMIILGILILGGMFFVFKAHERETAATKFLDQSWVSDVIEKSRLTTVNCGYYYMKLVELGYINKTYVEPKLNEKQKQTGNQLIDFTNAVLN